MLCARQILIIRSPYTPLLRTRTPPSGGTTEASAASTAAVPEPVKSTAVQSDEPPASRTSRSRHDLMIWKNSGSR